MLKQYNNIILKGHNATILQYYKTIKQYKITIHRIPGKSPGRLPEDSRKTPGRLPEDTKRLRKTPEIMTSLHNIVF